MTMPTKGDKVILHATNVPGFLCQSGFECVFDSMVRDRYKCILSVQPASTIALQKRCIAKIFDQTGKLIYQHDRKDCL